MRPFRLRRRDRRGRIAFTLPELLVAIGAVALVVVGVGRIFQSVGDLVGAGAALSEVDQMARSIERQMRQDFTALNQMASEDTFIAIRMRELGDVNRDGQVNSTAGDPPTGERAIYISQDDREDDELDIINGLVDSPYADGSRAITTRLDEIMFIAPSPAGASFTSFQSDRSGLARRRAPHARIYYGHALRPAPDPNWPPDPTLAQPPRVPRRQFVADGDFGQPAGQTNRFAVAFGSSLRDGGADYETVEGRNEYAGDWMLARQALLLDGGLAAGPLTGFPDRPGDLRDNLAGEQIEYAPFIRDAETLHRVWRNLTATAPGRFDHAGPSSRDGDPAIPDPRLIHHGRVDVCAQDLRDVRRWLEGEPPSWASGDPVQAVPFNQGLLSRRNSQGEYSDWPPDLDWNPQQTDGVQRFLWQRAPNADFISPTSTEGRLAANLRGVRSAIAGCFTRLLAESTPPRLDRRVVRPGAGLPPDPPNQQQPLDPDDALMDSHAVIAENCSRFEIAWSDGSTVLASDGIDFDNDGAPELREGDIVWFDITPLDPDDNPNFRATYRQLWEDYGRGADPDIQFVGFAPRQSSFPVPGDVQYAGIVTFPELGYTDWRAPQPPFPSNMLQVVENDVVVAPGSSGMPPYNPDLAGGADVQEREYLAIWPFRVPNAEGEYTRAWPKELLLRIRLTLHDTQRRLRGGKDFEFIFSVDLARN